MHNECIREFMREINYKITQNFYVYRVVQKLPASLKLRITFDRNKKESCGFRCWKEAVLLHSSMSYSTLLIDHKIIGQ